MFHLKIYSVVLLVFFCNCKGDSQRIDSCESAYKNARINYNQYFRNNQEQLLNNALLAIDQAMQCEKLRLKAVDLKVSLLILLKNYERGYKFIDSLNENDFNKKYKKSMDYNYFLALSYESKGDTVSRNRFLSKIVNDIGNYIRQEESRFGKIDEETYYDLFIVKSRFTTKSQIKFEIDSLKSIHPTEKEFLDAVESTVNHDSSVVEATTND